MDIQKEILTAGLPKHVAIIMDGNGRWAKERGLERMYGHKQGVDAVKKVVKACVEIGLEYLTLYTFSIENWSRPKQEISALMGLMAEAILLETPDLMEQGVKVQVIGNTADLPQNVWQRLEGLVKETAGNTGLTLMLALSYGARWEIVAAAKKMARAFRERPAAELEEIGEAEFAEYLTTKGIPDPDLLIRTSGECRLSNFLLWQCAYTEFYFIDKFWPDFEKDDLYLAIRNFQKRERRFGKTGEQLKNENNF